MRKYKTLDIVTINTDLIALSPEQAMRRTGLLAKTKKTGEYKPLSALTFKAGEVVGLSGDIAKTNMRKLVDLSKAEAEAKAKK